MDDTHTATGAINSIVIPLEQGLRRPRSKYSAALHCYSIVIPLEQGLRRVANVVMPPIGTFYRYSIRTRIKTKCVCSTLHPLDNSIVIPLEQGLRFFEQHYIWSIAVQFYRYSIRTRIKT